MNIILEGFDGTGKTTLQRQLMEATGIRPYNWIDRPRTREEYSANIDLARQVAQRPVIFDRHPVISEHIYRGNGGNRFDSILEELVMCKINLIVHCTGSELTIRPEDNGSEIDKRETKILKEYARDYLMMYDVLMSDLSRYVPVLRFDFSVEEDTQRIINYCMSSAT